MIRACPWQTVVSQLAEEMMMKLIARVGGVLSVLFLGVCIVACAAKRESRKAPAKSEAKTVEKEADEKETEKPREKNGDVKEKSE